MNKETIKNIVALFSYCQTYIPNSRRLSFSDLGPLLSSHVTEKDFDLVVVESIIDFANEWYLLVEDHKRPFAVLARIEKMAAKLKEQLDPEQKLTIVTVLLKLVKVNKHEANLFLDDVLYCIAELFTYSSDEINSIKKICYSDKLSESDYQDSILLTNELPDYIEVIDGLKVIYNSEFKFKIWVKNVKSVNNMLFKIIEVNDPCLFTGVKVGDVIVYNKLIQSILDICNVSLDDLSMKIFVDSSFLSRIHIDATERSPSVTLNSNQNRIEIEGVSTMEHVDSFFAPVFYWLEKINNKQVDDLEIHINLTFFNKCTSKIILRLFLKAMEFEKSGFKPKYYWYSGEGDYEMKEAGEHYSSVINRDFVYVNSVRYGLTCI